MFVLCLCCFFFFSSRRRHTRSYGDWSSDVCSSDLSARASREAVREALADASLEAPLRITIGRGGIRLSVVLKLPGKIGRASCRERGEMAVVGGAGKKKM